jgi:predicted transcriptional regulator
MSAKQRVLRAVRALPDEYTIAEIAEEIAILAAIERGEEDIAAGRTMAHEEVVNRARRWKTTK